MHTEVLRHARHHRASQAGSECGRRPVVGEENVVVVMCVCVWIALRRIRRLSKHCQTPQTIEDEPGPPPLCSQAPETENGLFV